MLVKSTSAELGWATQRRPAFDCYPGGGKRNRPARFLSIPCTWSQNRKKGAEIIGRGRKLLGEA